jgi:FkbM family methyltransferase
VKKRDREVRERELVRAFFGERSTGFFVEVGANDPKLISQTWHLEERGWRGVLVEPNPELAERLRQERKNSIVFQVACSSPEKRGEALFHFADAATHSGLEMHVDDPETTYTRSETVKVMTLDDILEELGNPKVDFVSIDVEGTELDVLQGFDLSKHRPSLILLEDKVNDLKKHSHLKNHGYRLVRRTRPNNWYVPRDADYKTSPLERIKLIRKMYLGTPLRIAKLKLRGWRSGVSRSTAKCD